MYSPEEINRYLNFLSVENEIFTFALLDKESKDIIKGHGTFYATFNELISKLEKFNGLKYTLHTTLNRTSDKGRKTKDIQSVRVLCVDLDTAVHISELKECIKGYDIQMVVESSPGKYHLYWKISPTISLELWKEYQLALAAKFNGDFNLQQIGHTIRVPGVERTTKEGDTFMPRIVYLASEPKELTEGDISELFGNLNDLLKTAKELQQKQKQERLKAVKEALKLNSNKAVILNSEGRNSFVFKAVMTHVSDLANEAVSEEEALELASKINESFDEPLNQDELQRCAISGFNYGSEIRAKRLDEQKELLGELLPGASDAVASQPAQSSSNTLVSSAATGTDSFIADFQYDYTDPQLKLNRFTEASIPARVIQRFGHSLLRVGKEFYAFNDILRLWRTQDEGAHPELTKFYQQAIQDTLLDPNFVKELATDANGGISVPKLKGAQARFMSMKLLGQTVAAVRHSPRVKECDTSIFDRKPEMLYTQNGVLNMKTGELREANANDYLLNRTTVEYVEGAGCPWWLDFLEEILDGSLDVKAMIGFMAELFGYSLSGSIHEQKIFCHYGDGSNGKSKVLYALSVLGGDHSTYLDPDEMVKTKKGFSKSLERFGAKVEGKRIVIVDDIDVKTIWNEAFVKTITSPAIRARGEYEKSRVVANKAKVHLGLNIAPEPEAENYGLLRRLCLIPYRATFVPDAEVSAIIDNKIQQEASGILNWAIAGYHTMVENGKISYPIELETAVKEYREEHFKLETIVNNLFERGEENDWEFLDRLVNDVNFFYKSIASTTDSLGIALKRAGFESKKIKCPKRGNSFKAYNVKLKFERQIESQTE